MGGAVIPLVLGVASLVVAVFAFIKAGQAEPERRTRLIVMGVALLLFTGVFAFQIVNALS